MKRLFRFATLALTAAMLLTHDASARLRPPLIPFPEDSLAVWRFDAPDWWQPPNPFPLALENLSVIESWSGYALQMLGPDRAILQYPCIDETGEPLLTCDTGTIRLWFAADWTSGDPLTTTPDNFGRLIETGQWTKDASVGWWSLYFNPDHTALYLSAQADGEGADFLKAPIAWRAGEWHLLTLTYSPKETVLYLDGQLAASGAGVTLVPSDESLLKNGFTLGGDHDGGDLAFGWFDDLTTFDRAQTGAEVTWYFNAATTFAKITPVDRSAKAAPPVKVDFNPLFLSSLESTATAEVGESNPQAELGNSHLRNGPMNNNSPLQSSNCLWLEITLTPTNMAVLTLHGTLPGTNYLILSSTNLPASNWVVETWMFTTNDQDWIETTVSLDRPAVFFRAGIGEDTDGDGLPDVYEILVTGTDPNNPDTGNTGTPDGYKDSDGDGLTNLDEFNGRTNPNEFSRPAPPPNFTARLQTGQSAVTLTWDNAKGPVTTYTIARADPSGGDWQQLAELPATVHSFADSSGAFEVGDPLLEPVNSGPPVGIWPGLFGGSVYRIQAAYAGGVSDPGYSTINPFDPHRAVDAKLVRGQAGRWHIIFSSLPNSVQGIRLNWVKWDYFYDIGYEAVSTDLTTNSFADGQYSVPDAVAIQHLSDLLYIQGVGLNGELGDLIYAGVLTEDAPYFVDGRAHLQENAEFLLRAGLVTQPYHVPHPGWILGNDFRYVSTPDYVEIGFIHPDYSSKGYGGPACDSYRPFVALDNTWPFRAHYVLRDWFSNASGEWTSQPVWHSNFVEVPIPLVLNTNFPYWTWQRVEDYAALGISVTSNSAHLGSGLRNIYGLPVQPALVGVLQLLFGEFWCCATQAVLAPGMTISAGIPDAVAPFGFLYSQTQQPVLETVSYYFAPVQATGPELAGCGVAAANQAYPSPISPGFSPTNTTPLIIASVGKPVVIGGWAKQRIVNGYTNKFAYVGQYFDKAYKLDEYGYVTTNQTGILSDYGEFFATEPGRAILTTKPDPGQGGIQGTALVHMIRLSLDANHDGVMDEGFVGPDSTAANRPFPFWVNDDNDGTGIGGDLNRPGITDYRYGQIRSQRNLEDYARLWVSGLPVLPTSQSYQATLSLSPSAGNPSINLYAAYDPAGGTGYLTDTNEAVAQFTQQTLNGQVIFDYARKLALISSSQSYTFPVDSSGQPFFTHFLFEGSGTGSGQLVLTVTQTTAQGSNVLAQTSAWFDLHDVKDLYERVFITNNFSGAISNWTGGIHTIEYPSTSMDDDTNILVLVHGINVGVWNWLQNSETTFKRLYWSGYRGKFATVKWPCDYLTPPNIYDPAVFNLSELNAYKGSSALKAYLNQLRTRLPGYGLHLLAHSQGNAIVSEAISHGAPFDTYIITQGAVPASAYDVNAPTNPTLTNREVFPYLTPEWRPMGYHGIYTNLTGRIVNFFNTNDTVLGLWTVAQYLVKPSQFYSYDGTNAWYLIDGDLGLFRQVTDSQESRAMISRSRTWSIGAQGPASGQTSQGVMISTVDLAARFGFTTGTSEHSAEFTRPIQTCLPYFRQVLTSCQIQPAP